MEASKRGVGASKKRAHGGSDDGTKLAIEAIIEVTKVAAQVSKRGVEASKRGIEASKKRQSSQVSKRGRVEEAAPDSSDRNEQHRSELESLEVAKRVSRRHSSREAFKRGVEATKHPASK